MKTINVLAVLLVLCLLVETALTAMEKKWWRRKYRRRCYAKNCAVSEWSRWGDCSQRCGAHGREIRTRHVTRHQTCGGRCHYTLRETRPCNRICYNGGVWKGNRCCCKSGYTGECCELKNKGTGHEQNSSWNRFDLQSTLRRQTRLTIHGDYDMYYSPNDLHCHYYKIIYM